MTFNYDLMMNKTYIGDDIDIFVGILNLKQH